MNLEIESSNTSFDTIKPNTAFIYHSDKTTTAINLNCKQKALAKVNLNCSSHEKDVTSLIT